MPIKHTDCEPTVFDRIIFSLQELILDFWRTSLGNPGMRDLTAGTNNARKHEHLYKLFQQILHKGCIHFNTGPHRCRDRHPFNIGSLAGRRFEAHDSF